MSKLAIILIVVLVIAMLVGFPFGGWHSYGYTPSGMLFVVLIVVILLAASGRF